MRVLVAIASFGTKNQEYLDRLLQEYRSMTYDVHVVVLSNIPKDLGPDVEVLVGLPQKNPWSLPFGHRRLFAARLEDYDLFIYSEDDTLLQQRHLEAFLEVSEILPQDRIAGFLRYEEGADGHRYCSTIHSLYHWVPGSVQSFGSHTFACFTNEHSACYVLTRGQLRRAIASGGFLVPSHRGRYDRLCSAATDPYTQCGFTKVICLSRAEDFLIHHLPNKYLGRVGISFEQMYAQIAVLFRCRQDAKARRELLPAPVDLDTYFWNKRYYGLPQIDVRPAVPPEARRILSVGCGDGELEASLMAGGAQVVGIPLDAVIAELARARGLELTAPDFQEAFDTLLGRDFDCALLLDVLGRVPDPPALLAAVAQRVVHGGRLILSAPNLACVRYRLTDPAGRCLWRTHDPFTRFHLQRTTPRLLARWARAAGLRVLRFEYEDDPRFGWLMRWSGGLASPYVSRSFALICEV